MRWSSYVVTPADPQTVVTLAEAKRELDVTHNEDDLLIASNIASAVDWCQNYTNRILAPTVMELQLSCLDGMIDIPFAPVQTDPAITMFYTANGALEAPIASFRTIPGEPFRLLPASGALWPTTEGYIGSARVRFHAGYAEGQVPPVLLQAIKTMIGVFYDKPFGMDDQPVARRIEIAENMARPYKMRFL